MRKQMQKHTNLKIVVIIIMFVFFLTISVGYSYLQHRLNIYGKSTIATDESGKYINGNSTYSYELVHSDKQNGTNTIIYDIKLNIVNMDNDIGSWQISFDVPQGYNDLMSNVKESLVKEYENGRITVYPSDEDGYLAKGDILELEMQLAINGELDIDNLTLNGRLASETN